MNGIGISDSGIRYAKYYILSLSRSLTDYHLFVFLKLFFLYIDQLRNVFHNHLHISLIIPPWKDVLELLISSVLQMRSYKYLSLRKHAHGTYSNISRV